MKRVAPSPRFVAPRPTFDLHTLQAVIVHRYDVLARYARAMRRIGAEQRDALLTMIAMRGEPSSLWERSMASRDQPLKKLQDWCRRAETSGIQPLAEFSRRLRSYA